MLCLAPAAMSFSRKEVLVYCTPRSEWTISPWLGFLRDLVDEGHPITPEILARLSPYKTEHINRFGQYELRFDQTPQPITEDLILE